MREREVGERESEVGGVLEAIIGKMAVILMWAKVAVYLCEQHFSKRSETIYEVRARVRSPSMCPHLPISSPPFPFLSIPFKQLVAV